MPQTDRRLQIAKTLLEIGAIRVNLAEPIKFVSGILSPIYCDNRLLLGHPDQRQLVIDEMTDAVRAGPGPVDCVAGTATAGIPHAAWVADRLRLPMVYVRAQAKAHGKGKQIEGGSVSGLRVVVVEDLVTTGGSSLQTVSVLREAGAQVDRCVAIFSYDFREADEAFKAAACRSTALCGFDALLEACDTLDDAARTELQRWHADPHAWQPAGA